MVFLKKSEEETNIMIKKPCQEPNYVGYNTYLLKHIVNSNMNIFPIQHMATVKVNMTTTKKYFYNFSFHTHSIHILTYTNK